MSEANVQLNGQHYMMQKFINLSEPQLYLYAHKSKDQCMISKHSKGSFIHSFSCSSQLEHRAPGGGLG
jgi:hypothetical protein